MQEWHTLAVFECSYPKLHFLFGRELLLTTFKNKIGLKMENYWFKDRRQHAVTQWQLTTHDKLEICCRHCDNTTGSANLQQ